MKVYGYIYQITNLVGGNIYIGCTVRDVGKRWRGHLAAVKSGNQSHLHRAIRKYGDNSFVIETIDSAASKEEMYSKERDYIAAINTFRDGMNMTEGGDGSLGWKHSDETKALKSKQMKGNKHLLGYRHSEETKKKIGEALKGNQHLRGYKYGAEYCQAISDRTRGSKNPMYGNHDNKPFLGKKHTDESRRKMSESTKGQVSWNKGKKGLQVAWNKGLKGEGNSMYGKNHTEETKAKMRKPRSEETKRKMSLAAKKRWAEHGAAGFNLV